MKQTAVEWLEEQLIQNSRALKIMLNAHKELFEQAEKMEKEHIIEAHNKGVKNGIKFYIESECGDDTGYISGNDYYLETFKSE